ncbi:MAG: histidine ammonia-lyase [Anaerolineae bacterium]
MNTTPPTPTLIRLGEDLTLADVVAVARGNTQVDLSEAARTRIAASRAWVEQTVRSNQLTVYGINTGFGVFANVRISPEQIRELMRRLILSHAAGVGEPLAEEVVRAALLIRANTLAQGYSGVRVEIVETLLAMLNRRVHPVIPAKGSVGASGDLAPLSHLALVLSTDAADREEDSGEAFYQGERLSGKEAMRRAGIPRLILEAKEGLALNNGTTISAALTALALADAQNLVTHSEVAVAMTLEAIRGISHAFDERIHRAGRHRGQLKVAARIRDLTHGSRLIDSTPRVQDAYCVRCAPQVIGAAVDTLEHAARILSEEINAATDNPLIFVDDQGEAQSRSGGNFHGAAVASIADMAAIAVSEVGAISERRTFRLLDAKLNDVLPMMLVESGGLNSGLMMAQVTAAALVSENKTLAHPDSVDSIPTSANQEDHVPMAANAARHLREVVRNTEHILGIELLAAAQAIDLRLRNMGAQPDILGPGTRAAHARIRSEIQYLDHDRILHPDIARATALVHSRELAQVTET